MDLQHCWIAYGVGIVVGTVITRIWLALDLDRKLPWKQKEPE